MLKSFIALLFLFTFNAYAASPALEGVLRSISSFAEVETPVVITDLDETIVDSTARHFYSYQRTITEMCGVNREGSCGKVAGLNLEEFLALPNRYDKNPLLDRVGVPKGKWRDELTKRESDIYLSGAFLELDQSVPGATEFVQQLHYRGAKVFFVSSRFDETQRRGTIQSLRHLGLLAPHSDGSEVILRPAGMSSIDFKRKSFATIREWARRNGSGVRLVMENEPENMNAMAEMFPGAWSVFVEGAYLKEEKVQGDPIRVKNLR